MTVITLPFDSPHPSGRRLLYSFAQMFDYEKGAVFKFNS